MRVLLDEHLDHSLRKLLGNEHEIFTVAYMGWAGLKNGELLRAAEENQIDVLVTGDQTLSYEQNLTGRKLAIIVVSAIQLSVLSKNVSKIVTAIGSALPGSFQVLDCGIFSRKRQ